MRDLRRLYRKLVGGVLLKSERASLLLQETIYTGRRQFQSKIILFSTDPDWFIKTEDEFSRNYFAVFEIIKLYI